MTYEGNVKRVKKQSSLSGTTLYFGELYEIRGGAGTIHVFAGSQRVASVLPDGKTQFYHTNHLGSSSFITDQNGAKKEKIEYFPFGTYRESGVDYDAGFPDVFYTFTGQEDDDDLGFYNFKARLSDPVLGRFISPDSIVQNIEDPQTLNRYSYARNNPLIYIDPTGQFSFGAASEFDLLYGTWDAIPLPLNNLWSDRGSSGSYLNSNYGVVSLNTNVPNFDTNSFSNVGLSSNINLNFSNTNFSSTYGEIGSVGPQFVENSPLSFLGPSCPKWLQSRAVLLDIAALSIDTLMVLAPPLAPIFYFAGATTSVANTLFTLEDWRQGNAEWYDFVVSAVTTAIGFYPGPVTLYGSDIAILIYDVYRAETYKGQKIPVIELKFRAN